MYLFEWKPNSICVTNDYALAKSFASKSILDWPDLCHHDIDFGGRLLSKFKYIKLHIDGVNIQFLAHHLDAVMTALNQKMHTNYAIIEDSKFMHCLPLSVAIKFKNTLKDNWQLYSSMANDNLDMWSSAVKSMAACPLIDTSDPSASPPCAFVQ